jgi:hypothetical protein
MIITDMNCACYTELWDFPGIRCLIVGWSSVSTGKGLMTVGVWYLSDYMGYMYMMI